MKLKRILFICFSILILQFVTACSTKSNEPEGVKIIYDLVGGTYKNCTNPIRLYFEFNEEEQMYIQDPTSLTNDEVLRSGYTLEGWYTDKEYTNKWDFEKDQVTKDGLTLYAKWKKNIIYKYNVCYYDKDNKLQIINSYEVSAGEKFNDYLNFAKKRNDGIYTPIRFLQENGEVWNENFTHPGGDANLDINVIVEYIEGDYAIVTNAKQLKENKNRNIYLAGDIDLNGEEFPLKDYRYKLVGNGFTISNCVVTTNPTKYGLTTDHIQSDQNSLYVSLFGNLKNATISNVTFDNVVFDIKSTYSNTFKIYVSPICTKLENSKVEDVSINVTYNCNQLPDGFDTEKDLLFVTDEVYLIKDESSSVTEYIINVQEINLGGNHESETN